MTMNALKIIPKEEVLSLEDAEIRTLRIISFSREEVQFPEYSDPAWDRTIPARHFEAMKIDIIEENGRPVTRHYWIDSKRLIGVLEPLLSRAGGLPGTYAITKHGLPPDSHYEASML